METQKIVEDLLLSSKNEDWIRRVLISSSVISNKFLDMYETGERSYFKGENFNFLELERGTFKSPDVIVVINRIISVYILGDQGARGSRKAINILGYNSYILSYTKAQLRKEILQNRNEFSFLQDSEFKVIYFPYTEKTDISPENYFFYLFREISKNRFIVNSLSNSLKDNLEHIKDNITRRDIADMVLDSCYT